MFNCIKIAISVHENNHYVHILDICLANLYMGINSRNLNAHLIAYQSTHILCSSLCCSVTIERRIHFTCKHSDLCFMQYETNDYFSVYCFIIKEKQHVIGFHLLVYHAELTQSLSMFI